MTTDRRNSALARPGIPGRTRSRILSGRVCGHAGFSLMEAVIGIAMVAIMAGILVPNIVNHLASAETARLSSDVQALGKAAKMFRLHVRRWPGEVQHLTQRPDSSARDVFGAGYSQKYMAHWQGPYLELVHHPIRDPSGEVVMRSSRGTLIRNRFIPVEWQGFKFMQVRVDEVTLQHARAISEALDGDTIVSVPTMATADDRAGRVRWLSTGETGSEMGSLLFLAARIDD